MTRHVTLYNSEKTYLYPNMSEASPVRVSMDYASVNSFPCMIETDASETIIYTAPEPIQVCRARYNIDEGLTDIDALAAIEVILNTPPTPPEPVEEAPTAEERIAAALEYQNLLSM